jgi:hypothetical protein
MRPYLEHLFLELRNIYPSRDIKSVSELYGQRLYCLRLLTLCCVHLLYEIKW